MGTSSDRKDFRLGKTFENLLQSYPTKRLKLLFSCLHSTTSRLDFTRPFNQKKPMNYQPPRKTGGNSINVISTWRDSQGDKETIKQFIDMN